MTLASSNVGSLGGLVALRDGLCHIAGSHLLDPASGEYTLPYVDRVLGEQDVAVVRLVHREQGLIVARGNPLGLEGIHDLARPGVRYVNRQRGAGTRVLLDHELGRRDIAPDAITGYAREEHTHLAVAAAVAAGRADAGLGIMAAARAFDLDFVPVTREPYDLVLAAQTLDEPAIAPLWALLEQPAFRSAVEALGGYGRTRWVAGSADMPVVPDVASSLRSSGGSAARLLGCSAKPDTRRPWMTSGCPGSTSANAVSVSTCECSLRCLCSSARPPTR